MKTGISTASFFSKELTENTFDIIRKLKIDTCEVFLTTFREYREEFVRLLNERREGIKIYSVHSLNVQFEPELFNTVQRTREDSEYFFKQIAAAANILGARYYTFHGLTRLKKTPYTLDYSRIGKRVDELDEMLSSLGNGCRLAYENVHWTCFNSPEFILQLKKYSNVKTCLDIKQAMQSKISVYDYLEAMGERLCNVHVCDYDADGNLCVPGRGIFDFVKFFAALADNGYDGPIIMELYAGNYNDYDEIAEGNEYLKYCLDKALK